MAPRKPTRSRSGLVAPPSPRDPGPSPGLSRLAHFLALPEADTIVEARRDDPVRAQDGHAMQAALEGRAAPQFLAGVGVDTMKLNLRFAQS